MFNAKRKVARSLIAAISFIAIAAGCISSRKAEQLQIVSRDEWHSQPLPIDDSKRQVPKLVTIHHEGVLWTAGTDKVARLRNAQRWGQREKNWPDLPYHYVIAPDGTVYEGRDWHYQPESNTNYSLEGVLNIELLGNFEEQRVDIRQLRSLVALIAKLCRELKLDPITIRGHKDAAPGQTVCPGKDFYRYLSNGSIRTWVEQSLAGKTPAIRELDAIQGGPTTQISETRTELAPTTKP